MQKVKLGVIGLGWVAQVFHLPTLKKFSEVEISCICDKDKSRARAIAEKYGIKKYYTDYEEMLRNEELNAVDICTTTDTHEEISIAALENKMDVFVEKPITRKYSEAVSIMETVKKTKQKLMVGMNHRFRPDTMLLRSFIENNELGKIFYVKTGWLKKPTPDNTWLAKKSISGGGAFLDLGIVMLDLALWMLGYPEVQRVTATNYTHTKAEVEDTTLAHLTMANNSTITIEISWVLNIENEVNYCNVYGQKGTGKINPLKIHKEMHGNIVNVTPAKLDTQNLLKRSYENELKYFVDAVRGIHPIISTVEEAVQRMKIVEAIYKSAEKKKEITFK